MRKLLILGVVLLAGCATRLEMGIGYDVLSNQVEGITEINGETIFFEEDAWADPIGIIGLSWDLSPNWKLDYRHISSLDDNDIVTSDALSIIFMVGGSREGWGMGPASRPEPEPTPVQFGCTPITAEATR